MGEKIGASAITSVKKWKKREYRMSLFAYLMSGNILK